ncbi:unnamed protein product [Effrenium voratum]|nr:unnamed protein product [Effrenium voratum]
MACPVSYRRPRASTPFMRLCAWAVCCFGSSRRWPGQWTCAWPRFCTSGSRNARKCLPGSRAAAQLSRPRSTPGACGPVGWTAPATFWLPSAETRRRVKWTLPSASSWRRLDECGATGHAGALPAVRPGALGEVLGSGARCKFAPSHTRGRAAAAGEQLCNGDQLTHNWSWWLHLDLALLALDFGTDLFCLLIFLGARNWGFAFLQLLLVSSTVARCVQRGPQAVLEAFKTSKAQGFVSQSYLEIAQAERIMRAPLAFVLQYYSFAFIAGDCFQVWILSISVLFSLVSATQGGFILVDLDVAPEQLSTLLRWDC